MNLRLWVVESSGGSPSVGAAEDRCISVFGTYPCNFVGYQSGSGIPVDGYVWIIAAYGETAPRISRSVAEVASADEWCCQTCGRVECGWDPQSDRRRIAVDRIGA
jgi:hypothetical protein